MSAHAGKKRSATTNLDDAPSTSKSHQQKKTRFVDPEDDPTNFEEQVDASLEGPARRHRRVKTEGYDSDSTDDGESVVKSRAKQDDEEDDMFAVGGDKKEQEETEKPKEKFMRLGDIEGQEFGGTKSDEDDDEDDDDEPEDEDDAERKKKAGMGFELSSFNMREEMEEGKFTEDGMYVRTFDPHGTHDRWMEGLSDREIKQARRRKKERDRVQKELQEAEERQLRESGGKASLEKDLLPLLRKGETILEALQRLGAKAKKKSNNSRNAQKSKNKASSGQTMNIDEPPQETSKANPVEEITHLASRLMSLGDTDIYSKTYEELVRSVRGSGIVNKDWEPPSADPKYEYKWASPDAGQTTEIFGPFGESDLKSWYNAAYFGPAGEKILVRQVDGDWGSWDDVVE